MRKVIPIPNETEKSDNKPIEFTHYLGQHNGWTKPVANPHIFEKIVYLGRCAKDGDMFAAYSETLISIYKGHLNSGTY